MPGWSAEPLCTYYRAVHGTASQVGQEWALAPLSTAPSPQNPGIQSKVGMVFLFVSQLRCFLLL